MSEKTGLKRDRYTNEVGESLVGRSCVVAGWIEDLRSIGSIVFLTVRDGHGTIQAVFNRRNLGDERFAESGSLSRQSFVAVRGKVKESKSKVSPFEIDASDFCVLGRAVHPLPLDPTGRVDAGLDTRLDARPLDLRSPRAASIFRIRALFLRFTRELLWSEGFMEVNTPKIIGAAAEGGAELFAFDYFQREAYLAQSPQLYKEELTLCLDRVYEIGTYFRAERMNTTRHLNEFVSLDVEAALCEKEDVMKTLEALVSAGIKHLVGAAEKEFRALGFTPTLPPLPFPIVRYEDAVSELVKKGCSVKFGDDFDAEALRLLGDMYHGYYFLVDWPASLKPFYIKPNPSKPDISESFDLMFGPLELASGGERVADRSLLEERLREKGLKVEQFKDHLKVYDWGMPPHSGWGFGVDRFVAQVTGNSNIREAVLYPRDAFRVTP